MPARTSASDGDRAEIGGLQRTEGAEELADGRARRAHDRHRTWRNLFVWKRAVARECVWRRWGGKPRHTTRRFRGSAGLRRAGSGSANGAREGRDPGRGRPGREHPGRPKAGTDHPRRRRHARPPHGAADRRPRADRTHGSRSPRLSLSCSYTRGRARKRVRAKVRPARSPRDRARQRHASCSFTPRSCSPGSDSARGRHDDHAS